MIASALAGLLTSRLGKYLRGLEDVSVGLWSGRVSIKRVQVKSEALNTLSLPFELVTGMIGLLEVSIPWTQLTTAAVTVTITDLILVIRPKDRPTWTLSDDSYLESIKQALERCELRLRSECEARKLSAEQRDSHSSYISQMLKYVLDNLVVNITNVHLRLEIGATVKPFPCGIRIQNVQIYNKPGENREECARKNAVVTGFSVYCGYIAENPFTPHPDFNVTIDNLQSLSTPSPCIHPVTIHATIVHSMPGARSLYTIDVVLEKYQVQIHPKQVKVFMTLNGLIRDYQQFLTNE